jgi:hypothetical protein
MTSPFVSISLVIKADFLSPLDTEQKGASKRNVVTLKEGTVEF